MRRSIPAELIHLTALLPFAFLPLLGLADRSSVDSQQ